MSRVWIARLSQREKAEWCKLRLLFSQTGLHSRTQSMEPTVVDLAYVHRSSPGSHVNGTLVNCDSIDLHLLY